MADSEGVREKSRTYPALTSGFEGLRSNKEAAKKRKT